MTAGSAQFEEFHPSERDGVVPSDEAALLRALLRDTYETPRDTYITENIPVLLARLSMVLNQR